MPMESYYFGAAGLTVSLVLTSNFALTLSHDRPDGWSRRGGLGPLPVLGWVVGLLV